MAFTPGDHVHVANFGKGIVRDVQNAERYRIEVKGRSMIVAASQLSAVDDRKRRAQGEGEKPFADVPATLARAHAPVEIDLHGMTAAEAVAALDTFLNDAILAAFTQVRVIHGRSGGRLKAVVHERLHELPPVRSFRLDASNPGVTIVAL